MLMPITCMGMQCPYGDLRWLNEQEQNDLDIVNVAPDADGGYILEVDLEYPPSYIIYMQTTLLHQVITN